jgi:hypothetical protein
MGAANRSAIGTLVERRTRFLVLLAFPDGIATTDRVRQALTDALESVPAGLRRTLTWDQGKELAQHQQITATTGTDVFFCDPHSPWQRGSNENMNGLRGQRPTPQDARLAAPRGALRRRDRGRPDETPYLSRARARGSTPARPSGLACVEPRARPPGQRPTILASNAAEPRRRSRVFARPRSSQSAPRCCQRPGLR